MSDIFMYRDADYLLTTESYSGFIDFKPLKIFYCACIIEVVLVDIDFPVYYKQKFLINIYLQSLKHFVNNDCLLMKLIPVYPRSYGLAEHAVQVA